MAQTDIIDSSMSNAVEPSTVVGQPAQAGSSTASQLSSQTPVADLVPEVLVALDSLVGERVFPVATGDGLTQSTLIALDASGVPIAVNVIGLLDQTALFRSLGQAGAAGRMSRGQLAAAYPGGLAAFGRDLQQYLEDVPFRRVNPAGRGSRLVIVCSDAQPEVLNAIDFLNRPELPINVLQAKVLEARDGTRFIDAAPLAINPNSAPGQPALLRPAEVSRGNPPAEIATPGNAASAGQDATTSVVSQGDLAPIQQDNASAQIAGQADSADSAQTIVAVTANQPTGLAEPTEVVGTAGTASTVADVAAPTVSAPLSPPIGSRKARRLALESAEAPKPAVEPVVAQSEASSTPAEPPVRGDDGYEQHYGYDNSSASHSDFAPPPPGSRRARRLAAAHAHSSASPKSESAGDLTLRVDASGEPSQATPMADANTAAEPEPIRPSVMNDTNQAIERAKALISGALGLGGIKANVANRPGRRSIREHRQEPQPSAAIADATSGVPPAGASGTTKAETSGSPYEQPIEFTGVFAKGVEATDHLSWDTTTLPVIARPITTSIPIDQVKQAGGAAIDGVAQIQAVSSLMRSRN